jgi:hypothetical protein
VNSLKKIGFYLFVALSFVAAFFFYRKLKESKKPTVNAISFIPDSCSIYLTSKNLRGLNELVNQQNLIIDKLNSNVSFNQYTQLLAYIDSIASKTTDSDLFSNNAFHFANYQKNQSWILTFNCPSVSGTEEVTSFLQSQLKANFNESHYHFNYGKSDVYFLVVKGVVCFSNNQDLLEKIINGKHKQFVQSKEYAKYKQTLEGNSQLNVFVQTPLSTKESKGFSLPGILENSHFAFNTVFSPDKIKAIGVISPDSNSVLSLLHNQEPGSFEEGEQLPYHLVELKQYYAGSFQSLLNSTDAFNKATDSLKYNVEKEFKLNIADKITAFKINQSIEQNILIRLKDSSLGSSHVLMMKDSVYTIGNDNLFKLKSETQFFEPFIHTPFKFVWMKNENLYFFESKKTAEEVIAMIQSQRNLLSNKGIMNCLEQELTEKVNYLYYEAPNLNNGNINNYIQLNKSNYQNFKNFVFTCTNSKAGFNARMSLNYEQESSSINGKLIWSCKLDTISNYTPAAFTNHLTNEKEIVTQDITNQLYLINSKGSIVWKKKINEAIKSEIFTVDIFKNNKNQLLFSTSNYLHLIDRNGNYVQGYPVKLPARSTNPLAVFDYDNDKNYRLFIACSNSKIYNYTIYGLKADGYVPFSTEAEVTLPLQYVKVGLSDYLVTTDLRGTIYTISRKGEGRIGLKNKCVQECRGFYVESANNIQNTYFCYLDEENSSLHKISFTDKKEIYKVKTDEKIKMYNFALVDDNKKKDVCYTSGNKAFAYDFNGSLIFEKTCSDNVYFINTFTNEHLSKLLISDSSKKILSVLDLNNTKKSIYNSNSSGLVMDIFKNNVYYLIFSGQGYINCTEL